MRNDERYEVVTEDLFKILYAEFGRQSSIIISNDTDQMIGLRVYDGINTIVIVPRLLKGT